MHSFQPSRGRIFFNVLCVFGIAASFAGAWQQTGASALLGAAGIAALYGLAHLFDMRRAKPAEAFEAQRLDFEPEFKRDPEPYLAEAVRPSAEDQPPAAEYSPAEAVVVELPAPQESEASKAKAPRKSGGRRAKAVKAPKAVEQAPAEEADVPWPTASEEGKPAELSSPAEDEFAPQPGEEASHPHIEPLFEPDPFVRMPRQAFGRRGRI